ncbi:phage tail length tape measure family protein [Devosia sp. Naph2]|uniref:phage tail length tape measure family protein n=1 Tax=Devosia polycyclovorans TaxID=3345148 RepID=UPI0035CFE108
MNPQMALAITAKNQTKPAFDQVVADANQVGTALQASGARAAATMNATAFATGNVAAQLNDIGVMMASGQSPLILAIQQGTQLNQIFSGLSGPQVLGALKTAFLSLINPISLVTIGTIAAGAALFQYVTSLNTDGRESTEVIKEQNDLIRRVAENWGDAVPSLKAYVDELDRAAETDELRKATDIAVGQEYAPLLAKLGEFRAGLAAARIDIQAMGGDAQEIDILQAAFDDLASEVENNSATAADLERFLEVLANTTGSQTVPTMIDLAAVLNGVAGQLAFAARNADQFRRDLANLNGARIRANAQEAFNLREFVAEQERLNGLTSEQLDLEREMERVSGDAKSAGVVLSEQQLLDLATQRLLAEEKRAAIREAERSGGRAAEDALKERDAVAELIAELEHEQRMIGMSNVEKEVANALRQAGAAATEEERLRIEELIVAIDEQERAQKALTQSFEDYGRIGKSATRGIVDILRDGKAEAHEWADLFGRIGDMFIDLAINGAFSLFGGGMGRGGFLGGLFGFSRGGGGIVGGQGSYTPGAADDTLFVAKAQKGEPFAFGQAAVDGLGSGGGAGGEILVHAVVRVENGNLVPLVTEVSGRVAGQQIKANNRMLPNLIADYQMREG